MLSCNAATVPKQDKTHLKELTTYFKELEFLYSNCSITNNTQKKKYTGFYVFYDIAKTWFGILEFTESPYQNWLSSTFAEFGQLEGAAVPLIYPSSKPVQASHSAYIAEKYNY